MYYLGGTKVRIVRTAYSRSRSRSTGREGFMKKKDIKMLEIQVDQERTRKRVEQMSRRGAGNKVESDDDD